MTAGNDRLEHLFSRVIDNEATPAERALLESLVREHPHVRSSFDDYRRLDDAFGAALRAAAGTPGRQTIPVRVRWWTRAGQAAAVSVAACLAVAAWLHPRPPGTGPVSKPLQRAGAVAPASWFAPPPARADVVEPVPVMYERPAVKVRGIERRWLIVPGDEPGVFRVIQVERVRTHAIPVERDF